MPRIFKCCALCHLISSVAAAAEPKTHAHTHGEQLPGCIHHGRHNTVCSVMTAMMFYLLTTAAAASSARACRAYPLLFMPVGGLLLLQIGTQLCHFLLSLHAGSTPEGLIICTLNHTCSVCGPTCQIVIAGGGVSCVLQSLLLLQCVLLPCRCCCPATAVLPSAPDAWSPPALLLGHWVAAAAMCQEIRRP